MVIRKVDIKILSQNTTDNIKVLREDIKEIRSDFRHLDNKINKIYYGLIVGVIVMFFKEELKMLFGLLH